MSHIVKRPKPAPALRLVKGGKRRSAPEEASVVDDDEPVSPARAILAFANVFVGGLELLEGVERGDSLALSTKKAIRRAKRRARAVKHADSRD